MDRLYSMSNCRYSHDDYLKDWSAVPWTVGYGSIQWPL